MRRFPAGLFFALFLLACALGTPRAALAQMKGEVESIGFNNHYRPNCWTPMVVRLTPDKSGTYQIQVVQEDLDRDKVVFTRTISLTGADEGNVAAQRFWMYFIPQPTNKGLYDVNRGGTLQELQRQVQVFLCDEDGKQLMTLPITQTVINLEPEAAAFSAPRGNKLILSVADGGMAPNTREYDKALGLLEQPAFVGLSPRDLPESALGYEAVDSILWLNAPPPDPTKPTEERRMRALQQFVRQGGQLIICQPPQRDATAAWGDLLPVTVNEITEIAVPEPLQTLAVDGTTEARRPDVRTSWRQARGPFRVALADPKAGTIVDLEFTPGAPATQPAADGAAAPATQPQRFPYIVRMPYGLGSVTWVAQDLSDPTITSRTKLGWTPIWDRVFDWKNQTIADPEHRLVRADVKAPYGSGILRDLGYSLRAGMELAGKSRAFVGLAIVFFIVYWLVAGPGVYLYLAAKARAQMSWFLFAFSGIVATGLTVLLVQLVVRGDPELKHFSVVRKAPGEPAVVHSRMGLYIPRDGEQTIQLVDTDPRSESFVTAFAEHPEHMADAGEGAPARLRYTVPIHEAGGGDAVAIEMPYRSTLKKLQAQWVGQFAGGVDGSATVTTQSGVVSVGGTITNGTGRKLKNVYVAFKVPGVAAEDPPPDRLLYLPSWDNGVTLDLGKEFRTKLIAVPGDTNLGGLSDLPERGASVQGTITPLTSWTLYWYAPLRGSTGMENAIWNDAGEAVPRSLSLLSLFDRLPPSRNMDNKMNRFELLRRGARELDVSQALSAGRLVVIAEDDADAPLPMPLDVEGERIAGTGTTLYQFALPIQYVITRDDEEQDPGQQQQQQQQQQQSPEQPQPPPPVEQVEAAAAPAGLQQLPTPGPENP